MSRKLENVRAVIAREGLDALLITQLQNMRYLSGFTGDAGALLISRETAQLATDFRYFEQVKMQAPDFELVEANDTLEKALAEQIARLGSKRLGFESHDVTVQTFSRWKEAIPDVEWVPNSGLVEELRQIKDARELATIKEAIRIADEAMAHLMEWIRPGMTEQQVAWEAEVFMRTHGAEGLSFTTIVGSGPNGAMPHAVTSDRPIQVGDPIVIDMGALYQGYCSDITRSFCLGQASLSYRALWDLVLQAQEAAEAKIVAGMTGKEADTIAREIIYQGGYEGKFGHGLGHSVGLAIHESPRASQSYTGELKAGVVLTVEPGVYIPGWAGVRIEDMVLIDKTECQVLTKAPKVAVIQAG